MLIFHRVEAHTVPLVEAISDQSEAKSLTSLALKPMIPTPLQMV